MQKLISIFAIVFFAIAVGHSNHENKFTEKFSGVIDKIIQKHWDRHVESVELSKRQELISASRDNNMEYAKSLSQKCDHDEVLSSNQLEFKDNLQKIVEKRKRGEIEAEVEEKPAFSKRAPNWQTIRFNMDNSYFSNNDKRACYSVGQKVVMGKNSTNLPACTNGANNCLYTCVADDLSSTTLQNVISQSLFPAVIDIFETALMIERVQGNLKLDKNIWNSYQGECYPGIPLSSNLVNTIGPGLPNSDMLVIGALRPCPSSGTVAYAVGCNFNWDMSSSDGIFGRPLVGHINFCPKYFQQFTANTYSQFDFAAAVKVGVHEFTHAMGFSSFFYDSYLDLNTGLPYTNPTNSVTKSGNSAAGNSYSVSLNRLATPRMLAVAKNHYGCSSMTGMELEDFGGSGTAGSHWEQRMVQNEYMAGFINPLMPVSYLTLSLFNDMGWYNADLSVSEYWTWGKDQGCNWINQRCETSWTAPGYFCTTSSTSGCTADRSAKGNCNVANYQNPLSAYYQHFTNVNRGGLSQSSDYCTFTNYNVFCANSSLSSSPGLSEVYGANSLCFPVGKNSQSITNLGCYKYNCVSETSLTVTIGSETLNCPQAGGLVNSVTLGGPVDCPTASLICRQVVSTNNTTNGSNGSGSTTSVQNGGSGGTTGTGSQVGSTTGAGNSNTNTITTKKFSNTTSEESAASSFTVFTVISFFIVLICLF